MNKYIVATLKKWNIEEFKKSNLHKKKNWYFISSPKKLTISYIDSIKPKYIFFPHWSSKVNNKIVNKYNCVCFHETNLPYGRGGSPIQNLIIRNFKKTIISAFKMSNQIDAGPIYLKKSLSLKGNAQKIYERSSKIIFKMIKKIAYKKIKTKPQKGRIVLFKRRKPEQSIISKNIISLRGIYNHIRMLDAETYPKAFIKYGKMTIEFNSPVIKKNNIDVRASIKLKSKSK